MNDATRSPTTPAQAPGAAIRPGLSGRPGSRIVRIVVAVLQFIGDLAATLARGLDPGNWRRTMREEFTGFFFHVGVRAIPAVALLGLLVGIGLVQQILYWLSLAAQEGSVGNFLVLVLVREISPVVAALIVIGRSGSVLLDEVGHLKVHGQIRMLESLGVDPTDFIAIPRCFAVSLAVFVLTMLFLYVALWSGFIAASIAGLTAISLLEFVDGVLSNMTLSDHLLLVLKPLITGFVVGYIPIWLGLRMEPSVLAVRRALPKSFVYSLLAAFVIGVAVSVVL